MAKKIVHNLNSLTPLDKKLTKPGSANIKNESIKIIQLLSLIFDRRALQLMVSTYSLEIKIITGAKSLEV